MKALLVHPGADVSTSDVYAGLLPALQFQGVEVIDYPLSQRISRVASWLEFNYRRAKKRDPEIARPTFHDTLYLAAERALPIALMEGVDWVIVVSGMYFLKHWLWLLRRAGLRVALLLTESPYDDEQQLQVCHLANVVWTNERLSVPLLRAVNRHTHYLPHAYDPEKHHPEAGLAPAGRTSAPETGGSESGDRSRFPVGASPLRLSDIGTTGPGGDAGSRGALKNSVPDPLAHDVVFVGSAFDERIELLSAVDWTGIDLGLYGTWHTLPSRHPLRKHVRGRTVTNQEAAALYRRAKIGLNLYRKSKGLMRGAPRILAAESLNPRALELAACGAFHLSDYRAEVAEVFGELVPTFTTAPELEALVRHYLEHPEARAIRAAGLPRRVLGRSFDHMAAQVVGDLERYELGQVQASMLATSRAMQPIGVA